MNKPSETDRIEKRLTLRTARSRVWRALCDSTEFGAWFGVQLTGPFHPGATVRGSVTHPGYEHVTLELQVVAMEPERYFSYRWRPNAIDPHEDYSSEPTTLVEFTLEETADGTLLTLVESGFDGIPLRRRAEAFRGNDSGWTAQCKRIEQYVSAA